VDVPSRYGYGWWSLESRASASDPGGGGRRLLIASVLVPKAPVLVQEHDQDRPIGTAHQSRNIWAGQPLSAYHHGRFSVKDEMDEFEKDLDSFDCEDKYDEYLTNSTDLNKRQLYAREIE